MAAAKKSSMLRLAHSREAELIHSLRNTLAALQIRFSMIDSDPTCRWAQEPNLTAVTKLLAAVMATTREMAAMAGAAPGQRRQPRVRAAFKRAGRSRRA
jgi:hypothetical protein